MTNAEAAEYRKTRTLEIWLSISSVFFALAISAIKEILTRPNRLPVRAVRRILLTFRRPVELRLGKPHLSL